METKTKTTVYRQGDVIIKRVENIPASVKEVAPEHGLVILAHGEVTGHHHSLTPTQEAPCKLFQDETGPRRYLDIPHPTVLRHQEHNPIELEAGTYEVVIQREYRPAGIVRVQD
jgi:hypothetical protein